MKFVANYNEDLLNVFSLSLFHTERLFFFGFIIWTPIIHWARLKLHPIWNIRSKFRIQIFDFEPTLNIRKQVLRKQSKKAVFTWNKLRNFGWSLFSYDPEVGTIPSAIFSLFIIRFHFLVATECDLNIRNGAGTRPSQTARNIQRSLAFFDRISTECDSTWDQRWLRMQQPNMRWKAAQLLSFATS